MSNISFGTTTDGSCLDTAADEKTAQKKVMRAVREVPRIEGAARPVHPGKNNQRTKADARSLRLAVRFTQAERQELEDRAHVSELPLADYIRSVVFNSGPGRTRVPSVERTLLAEGLGALNQAGALLARVVSELEVGETPYADTFRHAASKVEMAADAILRALGA